MELKQFLEDVKTMRDLQKQYFSDRRPAILMLAKTWEIIVDKHVERLLDKQGNLL
jgi:hypothetical protein